MSEKYINNGQVGAMGDHATASNFTFASEMKNNFKITTNDLEGLNKLIENLMNYNGKDVKKSEMMNASIIVQELAESVEDNNINNQSKSIGKWKSFISEATPAVMDVIKVASSGIGLAESVKTLLGI